MSDLDSYKNSHKTNGKNKSHKWFKLSLLLLAIASFEAIGLYSIQKFVINKDKKFLFLCSFMYGIFVPLFFYFMLQYDYVGVVNFLWNVFSTIFGFSIGLMLFKETVYPLQWVGVGLGILSFAFIILGDKSFDK
jgi:drug/metabolite transporter (DMT)-like permease